MYKRILAIGDIHGEYDKLLALYEKIRFNPPDDLLVFIGDYIDRGPKPMEVLHWLMERRNEPNIVMLRGNHEQFMLDRFLGKELQRQMGPFVPRLYDDWRRLGGEPTIRAFKRYQGQMALKNRTPHQRTKDKVLRFLARLPLSFRVEAGGREFFFCHAGVDPDVPLEEQNPDTLLWIRPWDFERDYAGAAVLVVGHTPVECIHFKDPEALLRNQPIIRDNMIFLDTGACYRNELGDTGECYNRPLSCVDVLSGRIWQSGPMRWRWPPRDR